MELAKIKELFSLSHHILLASPLRLALQTDAHKGEIKCWERKWNLGGILKNLTPPLSAGAQIHNFTHGKKKMNHWVLGLEN